MLKKKPIAPPFMKEIFVKQPTRFRSSFFKVFLIVLASASITEVAIAQVPTLSSRPGLTAGVRSTVRGHTSMRLIVRVDHAIHVAVEAKPEVRTPAEQKLESSLLEIANQIAIDSTFAKNVARPDNPALSDELKPQHFGIHVDDQDRVLVYVSPSVGFTNANLASAFAAVGGTLDLEDARASFVQAWIPVAMLKTLAARPEVRGIRRVVDPVTNTGSVTSLGVSRLRADVCFPLLSATGSGIKVGVMSDDCSSGPGGHLATSKSTGDINSNFVSLSDPDSLIGEHEGLAMSEIVQDVAPGAQIYFATAEGGDLAFGANMSALASNGCKVISDDVQYADEPVFEDGYLAGVVNSLSASGVVYVSSAGNQAGSSNYQVYANMTGTGLMAGKNVFDFTGSGVEYLPVSLVTGFGVSLVMQWDDPFGGSSNDYNIYLINPAQTAIVGSSTSVQNGSYPFPYEEIDYTVPSTGTYYIAVERKTVSGTDANATARIKITGWPNAPIIAFGSPTSSTFGHSCADSCLGAAAVNAASSNYNTIETYSGQGPSYHITFGTGTRTVDETRQKPDIACFDGVNTTVPGFAPFFGTSASSPHIAAVAALLLSANSSLTATQCRAAMRKGTIDEGAAGNDYVFGYGRLDAFKAITQMLSGTGKSFAMFKTVNTAIPDGTSSLSSTITPSLNANADSVYLSFTIDSHPKWGDLTVTLTSPDATTRTVLTRPASGAGTSLGQHPNVILGDNASTSLETYDPGAAEVIGFYIPQSAISSATGFHNRAISGNWTLNVADAVSGNSGTLKDWGIYWKVLPNANESLTLSATAPYIWSSDNSVKTVTVNQTINNGAIPVIKLNSVTANESVGGGDIVATTGVNTTSLQLRAQCDANIGRVYTATYELTDIGGYDQTFSVQIPVLRQIGHISAFPITSSGGTSLGLPSVNPLVSGTTLFNYTLSAAENVYLNIFDLHGKWLRSVDNGAKTIGAHNKTWDGTNASGTLLPDGTYIYQLDAGGSFFDGTVTLNH
jgi:subtilisin-like proprotein convertase family protein